MINAVADAGFNTIRLPVAWDSHANQTTHVIDASWLNRVKQVVDWSLAADLTVVLNTHWDGGWFENNIGNSVNPTIDAKVDSYWTQIANTFSSYDERLLFAAANEPNVDSAAEMSTLSSYYQTFVDAVRDVGGSNTSRWLVLQGPNTNIDLTDQLMNTLPNDSTADRLAVEVHYYDPWQFAGLGQDESWGDMAYFWGEDYHSSTLPGRNATWGEEDWLQNQLQKMNTKFVSQGVPVILGEFGAMNRTGNPQLSDPDDLDLHLASRLFYHQLIVDSANSLGIAPFYWDNGWTGQDGSGIFNRNNAMVFDQDTVDALTGGPGLPGDYNGNNVIDAADYAAWRDAMTAGSSSLANDPTPGTVDESDFDYWRDHFGEMLGAGTGSGAGALVAPAVPEPASIWLALFAVPLLFRFAARRRQD
jgi:aryl-phospho-beta-D-glucosidase BglC (GH1 family)